MLKKIETDRSKFFTENVKESYQISLEKIKTITKETKNIESNLKEYINQLDKENINN
jgi:hypothetical protein